MLYQWYWALFMYKYSKQHNQYDIYKAVEFELCGEANIFYMIHKDV